MRKRLWYALKTNTDDDKQCWVPSNCWLFGLWNDKWS
jgi:hypothetical protein